MAASFTVSHLHVYVGKTLISPTVGLSWGRFPYSNDAVNGKGRFTKNVAKVNTLTASDINSPNYIIIHTVTCGLY